MRLVDRGHEREQQPGGRADEHDGAAVGHDHQGAAHEEEVRPQVQGERTVPVVERGPGHSHAVADADVENDAVGHQSPFLGHRDPAPLLGRHVADRNGGGSTLLGDLTPGGLRRLLVTVDADHRCPFTCGPHGNGPPVPDGGVGVA